MTSNDGCDTSSNSPENQTAESVPASAVTVAGNIDLLTSILTRIEAKPLVRFKSVSKQWLSLISSPRFSHLHTLKNPNPKPSAVFFHPIRQTDENDYEFVLLTDPSSTPFRSLRFGADPSKINVLSSCNGLLLCSTRCKSWTFQEMNDQKHYIFNPTTKQFSRLTPPAGRDGFVVGFMSATSTRYSLAFDPLKSPHYKVLMVRSAPGTTAIGVVMIGADGSDRVQPKQMFEIHIYSSETRSWKKHDREIEWPDFCMFDQGVYWNGAMHWASKKDGVMCFDIDQERTRPMPETPPFLGWEETVVRYFGESGGNLHIVDIQGDEVMEIDVYVLERDYSKWSQKYRVDMNRFSASYPSMITFGLNPIHSQYYNFSVVSLLQIGEYGDDEQLVLRHPLLGKVDQRHAYRLRSFDGHLYSETLAWA